MLNVTAKRREELHHQITTTKAKTQLAPLAAVLLRLAVNSVPFEV